MAYGERWKKGADGPVPLLDRLRLILEHSHNSYTFRYRCKGQHIIIERMPDNSIVAYYDDGQAERVGLDVTQEPFDKIIRFSV